MKIKIQSIHKHPKVEFEGAVDIPGVGSTKIDNPPDIPLRYSVKIDIFEESVRDNRQATVHVWVDVKEATTMQEVEALALAEAKKFLEDVIPKF